MAEERVNRKLAAILAADVVGYSRLMGVAEEGTLAALKQHRQVVFDPAVAAHNGRVVKLIGDGTIVEFGSVVDAVHCALAVQRSNGLVPDEALRQPKIVLRIGINLGDVIIEGDDIYGDGVNIAARLEPLAEPGGICVSSIVNESVGNRVDVGFEDAGEITVKNIDRPIRVWKWHPRATPELAKEAEKPLPNVATASIAILPFTNMSGDPEQEYFSDGISEDIITDLSKIAGLTVIARNSSFTYKGRSVDIRTVGRELGVQSVLEGSIRRAGNRVRITAQLIDAGNGAHLWADRYDRDLTDIFAVQDDVTQRIVEALKITLSPAEKERLADSETHDVVAYDCVLRGREFMLGKEKNLGTFQQAIKYFKEALEHDRNYSVAYACLGFRYMFDYQNRWTDGPDKSLPSPKKALNVGKSNRPVARCVAALAASYEISTEPSRNRSRAGSIRAWRWPRNLRGTFWTFFGQPLDAIGNRAGDYRSGDERAIPALPRSRLMMAKNTRPQPLYSADHRPEYGFFPRHSDFSPRPPWRDRRRAAGVGGTDGHQPEIFVLCSRRPPAR